MKIVSEFLIDSKTGEPLILDFPNQTIWQKINYCRYKAWEAGRRMKLGLESMDKTLEHNTDMNNVFVLYPTRSPFGVWAFDDDQRGLVNEPFVGETNTLIDKMAVESGYDLKDNPQIALLFSASVFPGHQCDLSLLETSPMGTTYNDKISGLDIWLCPAFYKFYEKSPLCFYGAVVTRL